MTCDLPCISYMALYIISLHIIQTNTRTSTHWKLNYDEGRVVKAGHLPFEKERKKCDQELEEELVMDILTSTVTSADGTWKKTSHSNFCVECQKPGYKDIREKNAVPEGKKFVQKKEEEEEDEVLDCGKAANFTYYDHLVGIANRHTHPHVPEPQVALIFKNKKSKKAEVDVDELERKLKKAKREKPRSVQLYNQIGNFWRIKGDTQKSIECFRRALAVSPNNAEVLLNLARVLFNLQYLDDAIFLTRRSLEVQPPDQNAWLQHFTLGEILKAYGHYQEAALHLRHALELKPLFQPAIAALRDMEAMPDTTIHVYTLLIIVFLVLGVLLGILSSVDSGMDDYPEAKTHRHFNRAMAMRSIKLGISPRAMRPGKRCSNNL